MQQHTGTTDERNTLKQKVYGEGGKESGQEYRTCEKLLLDLVSIQDRRGDAGHGADHAAQTQVDEHEEEHY